MHKLQPLCAEEHHILSIFIKKPSFFQFQKTVELYDVHTNKIEQGSHKLLFFILIRLPQWETLSYLKQSLIINY